MERVDKEKVIFQKSIICYWWEHELLHDIGRNRDKPLVHRLKILRKRWEENRHKWPAVT